MFAKVYTQVFDSSIADNWKHRHVFEDLLKLCDQTGLLDMTQEAIAARTRMPLEMVCEAIKALSEPDPRSRTHDHEGRRLILLDCKRGWGWKIVNYQKYRSMKTQFDRTAYMAEYMRNRRKSSKVKQEFNKSLTESNELNSPPSASSSPSPSVPVVSGNGGTGEREVEFPCGFPKTEQEALGVAATCGATAELCLKVWNKAASRGGCDSKGHPISSFHHFLTAEVAYERERTAKANAQPSGSRPARNSSVPDYSKGF